MFIFVNQKITQKNAVNEIFNGKFGKADSILIEEFLEGEEMSYFVICDGKDYKFFQTAQDHKELVKEIQVLILVGWEHTHHLD